MRADQDEKPDDEADDSENGEEEDLVGDILSKAKDIPEEKEEEDVDEESNDGQRQSIVEKISSSIQSMGQLSAEEEERAEAQREIDRQILMSTNELNEDVWSESEKEKHAKMQRLEKGLMRIDRPFLTSGVQLLILLPAIIILLEIMAWNWWDKSPEWWENSVEDVLGIEFGFTMVLSAVVVSGAWMLASFITRQRLWVTQTIMANEVDRFQKMGRPFSSMHGYPAFKESTSGSLKQRTTTLMLCTAAFLFFLLGLFNDLSTDFGVSIMLLGLGATFLGLGLHLVSSDNLYSTYEPGGILSVYEPPVHPALLGQVFSDLMLTHMDPFLRMRFEDFMQKFRAALLPGFDPVVGRERLFYILHLHRKGSLSNEERFREVAEIIEEDEIDGILNHPFFNDEVWEKLVNRCKEKCPSFFRILDRLEHSLRVDVSGFKDKELIFDVDMENVVYQHASLFCLLVNNSNEERNVVLRIESPDFRPEVIHMNLSLPPAASMISALPAELALSSEGDDDVLAAIANLLNLGKLNWQTLLPIRLGEATVSVSLEDEDGDLILGKVVNLRVKSEWNQKLTKLSGLITLAAGSLAILSAVSLPLFSMLSL
tara:strand:- start:502 stop:2295 length:1794 start_codon:yes stop_codon:yes gene_type:complete